MISSNGITFSFIVQGLADDIIIFSVAGIVIAAVGLVINHVWNARLRADRVVETRAQMLANVEEIAKEKYRAEQSLAKELARENENLMLRFKEELRDYIDKGDSDVKRELAYAVRLIEKDIKFIQQFIFGKETKSMPGYLTGKVDTAEHEAAEGKGMFKDTEQESDERDERESGGMYK